MDSRFHGNDGRLLRFSRNDTSGQTVFTPVSECHHAPIILSIELDIIMILPTKACLFLTVFLLVLPMSSLAHAENHVDAKHMQSANSNSGAISRPWKSLYKANSTLQPGDTVYLHEGRYSQSIAPVNSGDVSRPGIS